jgi:hypothetical protein
MDHDPMETQPVQPTPVAPVTPVTPVTPVAPVTRPARPAGASARFVNLALGAALVVAVGGVAFAAGRGTAPATSTGAGLLPAGLGPNASFTPGGVPGGGLGGRGLTGAGGVSLEGTVVGIDEHALRIETESGQTIELTIDGETEFHRQADAGAADLSAGSTVIVRIEGGVRGGLGGGAGAGASGAPGLQAGAATDVTIVP